MLIIHKKILSVHLFMGVSPQALKNVITRDMAIKHCTFRDL